MKRNKFLYALLSSALSFTFAFSLSACFGGGEDTTVETPTDTSQSGDKNQTSVEDGEGWLVKDAQTEYKIVLPQNPHDNEYNAASELGYFFKAATGANFEVVNENAGVKPSGGKYLFVGNTDAGKALGVDVSEKTLTSQGFKIVTEGDDIYLLGGGTFGTVFSAYSLLEKYIDFDVVAADEIVYKESKDLKFLKINATEVPDFEYRVSGNIQTYNDPLIAQRFRYILAYGNGFMTVNGRLYHNAFSYIPPAEYNDPKKEDYHPDWYSGNGTAISNLQVCYTAHGNKTEYEALLNKCLDVLYETVLRNPNIDNVQFSMEDNTYWCSCETCAAEKAKYGTDSAVVIKFCNDLHAKLAEKLAENGIDRKVNLVFFGYLKTTEPPVVKNSDGGYSPIDDSVRCDDGVYVFLGLVYAKYVYPAGDTQNEYYVDLVKRWKAVSSEIYLWTYGTNYRNYYIPYNTFNSMKETYALYSEYDVRYIFEEGQHYATNQHPTGFTYLKDYLLSKIQWDTTADAKALTDKFFEYYFKDASKAMRKYYDELRVLFEMQEQGLLKTSTGKVASIGGGIFEDVKKAELWPQGMLMDWIGYIDEAYAAIEKYATSDPTTYKKLERRIKTESIAPRYLYLTLYLNDSSAETTEMRKAFMKDMQQLGNTEEGQGFDLSGLWTQWGIA
ncbi:MAG: DUF4838 domain-containing protein [Clostridia bacterium]|nr:DUF4838 domain-containing protein [Clostridia bacterium]